MYTALSSSACRVILFALYSHTNVLCVYTYTDIYMYVYMPPKYVYTHIYTWGCVDMCV